jgi:hypothetical protein
MLELFAMATAENFLSRYLDPVADALTPQAAQTILNLTPAPDITRRVEELGQKSDAGTLTAQELDEYKALADAGTLIALLKAKARRALSQHPN